MEPRDAWELLQARRAAVAVSAGASADAIASELARAEDAETASTWALVEVAGCGAAHALPACSPECLAEGWRESGAAGSEADPAHVGLTLALTLERLGRRQGALDALARAHARCPADPRVRLTLAKLLFKAGHKEAAGVHLACLTAAWHAQQRRQGVSAAEVVATAPTGSDACAAQLPVAEQALLAEAAGVGRMSAAMAGDAFYIRGWNSVHNDDHSRAYAIWSEGALAVPGDARLCRQRRKVRTWDPAAPAPPLDAGDEAQAAGGDAGAPPRSLLGAGAHGDGVFDARADVEAHAVPAGQREPALALFDDATQRRALAFVTRRALLTPDECSRVVGAAEAHVASALGGAWGTVRRSSVPTTDVAVEDVPGLARWLRALLATRLCPLLAACFPRLADGSDLGGAAGSRLRVHDAFIVRYDARDEGRGSTSLPEHSDTSALSLSLALNQGGGVDYAGGGTWIRALAGTPCRGVLEPPMGHAVAFAGPLRHGGHAVTAGVRMVLVLFLYVEGWPYGHLLAQAKAAAAAEAASESSSAAGCAARSNERGYVVYRETAALVDALDARYDDAECS